MKFEKEGELVNRVYMFELPFDYTMYITSTELLFWGALIIIVVALVIKSFFIKVQGGREGLVNQKAVALADFSRVNDKYTGQVLCMGEIWAAKSCFPMKKGERSKVSHSEGMMLSLCCKHDRMNNDENCIVNNDD